MIAMCWCTRTMLKWLKCRQSLCKSPHLCPPARRLSFTLAPLISFIQPSVTSRWLCSRPVGVERPICRLILLRRRAVNTHFCGCQFGEGGQPCGTQRSISSIPSRGNIAGYKLQVPLFSLSSQRTTVLLPHLPHIDLEVMFCVICHSSLLFESTCLYTVALIQRNITVHSVF